MKKVYLLKLEYNGGETKGTVVLANSGYELVVKGINQIMGGGSDYYQSYAKNVELYTYGGYTSSGSYTDGVSWKDMIWELTELTVIS